MIATVAFVTLVESVLTYETVALWYAPGVTTISCFVSPLSARVAVIKGAVIVTVASWVIYVTASVWSLGIFAVPIVKWKTRCSLSWPVRVPVSVIVLLAPGRIVPIRKLEPLKGSEESVTMKPKGKAPVRTTLSSGTVAFERTRSVNVSGFPDTVSASVSTDTESGVEEIESVYEDFFIKDVVEPPVP